MTDDNAELELLRREYLADVLEKIELFKQHGRGLGDGKHFKASFPALLFLSHQLKGSGGSVGFPKISEVAREIGVALNQYLEDDTVPRPTSRELSATIIRLSSELEREVRSRADEVRS